MGLAGTVALGLLLSGCAAAPEQSGMTGSLSSLGAEAPKGAIAARDYWATAYAKNPHDEKAVISFAHALKADGSKDKALSVLQQAAIYNPDSKTIAAEEGRLALDMGQIDFAEKLLNRANDPVSPDWRILNALGTLQAQRNDRAGAQGYFERAARLQPNDPVVLNNLALCYALGGDPAKAEQMLRKAAAGGGNSQRIRQNLALVLGVEGKHDEAQQLASADLGKDQAEANRQYMQKMVAATPMPLGKRVKPVAETINSAWQTALEKPPQPIPGHPVDSGDHGWIVDVAKAPQAVPAPKPVAALMAPTLPFPAVPTHAVAVQASPVQLLPIQPMAVLKPNSKPWSIDDISVSPN